MAWGPVGTLAVAVGLLMVVTSGGYGYHRDELYFRLLGQQLAWGYVDQPPGAPLLARLTVDQLGDQLWALRIPGALALAGTVLLTALLARELGGGRWPQLLAGAGALMLFPLVSGHLLLTSTLDMVITAAILLLVVRALLREPRWWLAVGALAGVALYNKNLVVLMLISIGLALLIVGPRRVLWSRWVLAGVGLALVIGAPNLVYQVANDWPQLDFNTRGLPSLESITRTVLAAETLLATTAVGLIGRRLGVGANRNKNRMTQLLGDVGAGVAGLDFEIDGREHLHRNRPAIFVFNHQSLLDSVVLAHLLREDVVAFCKKEMAANPLVGSLLRQMDTVFVDRADKDQAQVLRQAQEILASGRSLVIAPEGTRSVLGEIQPFKHGAFYLARKAGVPLVPIVLHNVKDALPKGSMLIRPATIRITVLPPIQPEAIRSVRQACSQVEDQYIETLGKSRFAALPQRASAWEKREAGAA